MFGSRLYANDGSLIASESTYNPVYVGDATPISYEIGARFGLTDYYLKRIWTLRISCANRPIPFLVPVAGEILALLQVTEVSTGQWNIVVAQGQEYSAPRVLCFTTRPLGTPSGYGYAIFDSVGNTCFDSTKNHLIVDAIGKSQPLRWRALLPMVMAVITAHFRLEHQHAHLLKQFRILHSSADQ